ncbi:hypothetical protein CYMTET_19479 [Cymbomonas tetramitiformis]|uniref:Uncharacterized protein n=1 Tax=Cymbomonas tetramitiformis TaxID=36881 RepID=A0AAE0L562_9CHLO|nr:hypothetical protein CYMTET_19479 [Cymbomonas tetramitiformis]
MLENAEMAAQLVETNAETKTIDCKQAELQQYELMVHGPWMKTRNKYSPFPLHTSVGEWTLGNVVPDTGKRDLDNDQLAITVSAGHVLELHSPECQHHTMTRAIHHTDYEACIEPPETQYASARAAPGLAPVRALKAFLGSRRHIDILSEGLPPEEHRNGMGGSGKGGNHSRSDKRPQLSQNASQQAAVLDGSAVPSGLSSGHPVLESYKGGENEMERPTSGLNTVVKVNLANGRAQITRPPPLYHARFQRSKQASKSSLMAIAMGSFAYADYSLRPQEHSTGESGPEMRRFSTTPLETNPGILSTNSAPRSPSRPSQEKKAMTKKVSNDDQSPRLSAFTADVRRKQKRPQRPHSSESEKAVDEKSMWWEALAKDHEKEWVQASILDRAFGDVTGRCTLDPMHDAREESTTRIPKRQPEDLIQGETGALHRRARTRQQLQALDPLDTKPPSPVDPWRMRKLHVKLKVIGILARMLQEKQDLNSSKQLCGLLNTTLVRMQLCIPIQELRGMVDPASPPRVKAA